MKRVRQNIYHILKEEKSDPLRLLNESLPPICLADSGELFPTGVVSDIPPKHPQSADIMKLLISRGLDVNQIGESGYSPLHAAFLHKHSLEFIQVLVEAKADVEYINPAYGSSVFNEFLDGAGGYFTEYELTTEEDRTLRYLMEMGAFHLTYHKDEYGRSPESSRWKHSFLHMYIEMKERVRQNIVKFLLPDLTDMVLNYMIDNEPIVAAKSRKRARVT